MKAAAYAEGQGAYRVPGEHAHQAAAEDRRRYVAAEYAEHGQHHRARRRTYPGDAALPPAHLPARDGVLQQVEEDAARYPDYLRDVKRAGRGLKQHQIQRPVQQPQCKAAVEAREQEQLLAAPAQIQHAGYGAAGQRRRELRTVVNYLDHCRLRPARRATSA